MTYPSIAQWLSPSSGGGTQPGQENLASGTICLSSGRFEMKVNWTNPNAGNALQGVKLIRFSDTAVQGYFSNPSNAELLAKMLNGCSLNRRHWVFVGGVTDQNVIVDVRDAQNGATKRYQNPRGTAFQTVADTQAFATCP